MERVDEPPSEEALRIPEDSVTLYRDNYGVPHVFANTDEAAFYALGYAQAEDRLEDIYRNVRMTLGRTAEVEGPGAVEQDFLMRLWRVGEVSEQYWDADASEEVRGLADAFIAGVEAYAEAHPGAAEEWALPLEPWHPLAVARLLTMELVFHHSVMPKLALLDVDAMATASSRSEAPPGAVGSNQWAVAPERAAHGGALLLADVHLPWEPLSRFYEARVRGETLHLNGFFVPGAPLPAYGHNRDVGFAVTVGGPETADVYVLTPDPDDAAAYLFDGQSRTYEQETFSIEAAGLGAMEMTAWRSHHGPLLTDPTVETPVAVASLYFDAVQQMDQALAMARAEDVDELLDAVGMLQLAPLNFMAASTDGTIAYARTGLTPVRPEGYDWTAPVSGDTSATMWESAHPLDDLVQLRDPAQGYFQNNNTSPEYMMEDSSLLPGDYPEYIYGAIGERDNPRSRRAREVLHGTPNMTVDDALRLATDVFDLHAPPWLDALDTAIRRTGDEHMEDGEFMEGAELVLGWDGAYRPDSVGALPFRIWRERAGQFMDVEAIMAGDPLSQNNMLVLLDAFDDALAITRDRYGSMDAPWGDAFKLARGDQEAPASGASYGAPPHDTVTLLTTWFDENPPGSGCFTGSGGAVGPMLMVFHEDGVESYTAQPWGQSNDPDSPHYFDQARELFSVGELRPTAFTLEALEEAGIASETALALP